MRGYTVAIKEASRDLSTIERVKLKETTNAVKLDEACNGSPLVIEPAGYVVLAIHNDKSDEKDYEQYIVEGRDGTKYLTGSPSFWDSFMDIWEELREESEPWRLEVFKLDSKNYKGKQFLTCSVI